MKLNASKTKTMIVSRSQPPALTIGGTVLKESDDLVILGVTFDSKMTFEKHLRSVSRAASQWLGILRSCSLSLLSFYGLVLWGWGLRTDRVLIALSQPCIANLF